MPSIQSYYIAHKKDGVFRRLDEVLDEMSSSSGVTSVGMSVPTGLAVSGSPVMSSGTLAVTYDTGYQGYTSAEATKLSGIEAGATADQTAAEILTAIKTADGAGTGLDADLLDGNEASAFATAAQGALADSALQSSDIGVTVQGYSAILTATTASFTTADETKLDGIEAAADVTDATNVAAAGAHMVGGTDISVDDGGTGRSSHTAYAVICGGATTIAAQQSIAGVGTSGQVLTSNGAGALPTFQDAAGGGGSSFPAGTKMLFVQTSAPTGWTKDTDQNNKALRIVSGTAGTGGSSPFSTVFGKTATDAHTLTEAQIPSHRHGLSEALRKTANGSGMDDANDAGSASIVYSDYTGGGGSHTHGIDIRVQYVDVIKATKD